MKMTIALIAALALVGCVDHPRIQSMPPAMTEEWAQLLHSQCAAEASYVMPGTPAAVFNSYGGGYGNRFAGGYGTGYAQGFSSSAAAMAAYPQKGYSRPHYLGCMARHGIVVTFD